MSLKNFGKALLRRKYLSDDDVNETKLNRCLSTLDLTLLGVGSTLGLGIYVLAGQVASSTAGPAVCISFLIAAIASIFAALCYAEFGARVPKAGSAYVYSYVTVGELMAFIIGWNLILEYVIGTASVARGYSGYLDFLLNGTLKHTFTRYVPLNIPELAPYPDFLALGITLLLTALLALGVKESARFNNIFTGLNLLVVIYVVITGLFKVNLYYWQIPQSDVPAGRGHGGFLPYGISGMMQGASMCFYAYVGFDCIATTGEEVKNPQKAIPIGIITSLFIVFISYFGVSVIQTMIWPYYDQDNDAPLPYVFDQIGWVAAKWVISVGALAGLSTSLLGSMFPLPRVLSAMANDGLIFKSLADIHPTFKTPMLATFISGAFAAVMAMFFDVKELAAMMSIGTLLAYTLVAISVLLLRYRILDERIHLEPLLRSPSPNASSPNHIQNSSIMADSSSVDFNPYHDNLNTHSDNFFNGANFVPQNHPITGSASTMMTSTHYYSWRDIGRALINVENSTTQSSLSSTISMSLIGIIVFLIVILDVQLRLLVGLFDSSIAIFVGIAFMLVLVIICSYFLHCQPSDQKQISFRVPYVPLIPVSSIIINIYLMMTLSENTWIRFGVWMVVGFLIYFGYGIRHSVENFHTAPTAPILTTAIESTLEVNESDTKSEHSPLLKKQCLPSS